MLPHERSSARIQCADGGVEGASHGARQSHRGGEKHHSLLENRQVHAIELGIVARGPPVGCALGAREDRPPLGPIERRGEWDRAAVLVQAPGPVLADKGGTGLESAALPIQHVVEPIAIGPQQPLARARGRGAIRYQGHLVGIPIVHIAGRELEVPQQLAGFPAQRDDGVGIQIIALAAARIEVRLRVANTPVERIGLRVIRAGHPRARAAALPGIPRPGLVARIARTGNGIEAPALLAGVGIVGRDESTAVTGSRSDAGDDEIAQRERRGADV